MLSALYRTIESEEKVGVGETQGSVGDTKTKKERGGGGGRGAVLVGRRK